MHSPNSLEEYCQSLAPWLDRSKTAIVTRDLDELEQCMAQINALLGSPEHSPALDTEADIAPRDRAAIERLTPVIRRLKAEVDDGLMCLEEWKTQIHGSLEHLNTGGQAVGHYAAVSQHPSDVLFRVRA